MTGSDPDPTFFGTMRGQYGGGHGMQIERLRVPGRRPMESYRLRKKARRYPELMELAGRILDAHRQKKLADEANTKSFRAAIRAKTAEEAVRYMSETEDRPLTDL